MHNSKIMTEHKESTRSLKVTRLIQKELSTYFQRESPNISRGKMISVTHVRITPDFGLARVHLSIFPSAGAKETLINIKAISPNIRYFLGGQIKHQLRSVPELEFFIDDSLDYVEKIDELLKK